MSVPFSEWTREEKDEFARRRMDEMKLLNEKYKQRHAEVERDRMRAEEKNSSVTSLLGLPKEKSGSSEDRKAETDICSKPKVKEREWDRGKSQLDMEDWSAHKYQPRHQANWRDYSDKRSGKKEENWRDRSANSNRDYQGSSSRFRESGRSWGNRKYSESSNQGASNYRNDSSFPKERGRGYNRERNNYTSYRSFHNSKVSDSRKKTFVGASGSASQSPSDSEIEPIRQSTRFENDRIWRDGGMNEVRHRQIRVEKWVKSINSTCLEDVDSCLKKEVECQDTSCPKYDLGDPGYNEGKCLKNDSKISDPDGIWEDLDQEDQSLYQKSYEANNPPQSASTRFSSKKTGRRNEIDDNEYSRSTMQKSKEWDKGNKQWKRESHSKNQISSDYSGTYENQSCKKQSDRRSNWKKPDNVLRKGKYVESKLKNESRPSGSFKIFEDGSPSGDNCEWSSHELESNDSVLVKIASHTVKRTVYNSFVDTERDNMQNSLKANECLDYSGYETEMATDLNPIQVSENIQRNSIESGIWDDCGYGDDIQILKSEKQGSDILCQESSLHSLTNAHSEKDHADCDTYQMEAEKLHPSNGNESEYANTKVIPSEMGDFVEEPCNKEHFNLEDIIPAENDSVTEENNLKFNNESSLNIESADMQGIVTKNVLEEITVSNSSKTVNILNSDDQNKDVQCLNTINPEMFHGTSKNLEDVEFMLNESAPLGISPGSEALIAPTNDFNTKELVADAFVVLQDIEIPMEESTENLNLEPPCPFAELSAQNMSITSSDEDPNSSNVIIETLEKQVVETSVQKDHALLNELTGLSSEIIKENVCFTLEAKNTSRPSTPADDLLICQIEEQEMDEFLFMEINASISKKEDIDKHLGKVKQWTPDDSLPK